MAVLMLVFRGQRRSTEQLILPVTVEDTAKSKDMIRRVSNKQYKRVIVKDASRQTAHEDGDTIFEKMVAKSRRANGLEKFNGSLGSL